MRANLLNPLGPRLILASRSPRRAELLTLVGAHFDTVPVDVDERPLPDELPEAHVLRLAMAKAYAAQSALASVGGDESAGDVIVAADTVVVVDRSILGKPSDAAEAERMLSLLSGRIHEVWTGLFLLEMFDGPAIGGAARSIVKFAPLDSDAIRRYVETGEPLDKAGAYAVQGRGALFVEAIEGSYTNVVGLPLSYLNHLLGMLPGLPLAQRVPGKEG